jgi:hydrogenase expression/formation protein HypC
MCLAVPAKVIKIEGKVAEVEVMGNCTRADISSLPDLQLGDYVILHSGYAIHKYDPEEAAISLEIYRELLECEGED